MSVQSKDNVLFDNQQKNKQSFFLCVKMSTAYREPGPHAERITQKASFPF